jgi:hypothetical protein
MSEHHEGIYRRAVETVGRNVDAQSYDPQTAARIVDNTRAELAQCIELGLISSRFYSEQMERLGKIQERVNV